MPLTAGRPSKASASGTPTAGSRTPITHATSRLDPLKRAVRTRRSPAAQSMSSSGEGADLVAEGQADVSNRRQPPIASILYRVVTTRQPLDEQTTITTRQRNESFNDR